MNLLGIIAYLAISATIVAGLITGLFRYQQSLDFEQQHERLIDGIHNWLGHHCHLLPTRTAATLTWNPGATTCPDPLPPAEANNMACPPGLMPPAEDAALLAAGQLTVSFPAGQAPNLSLALASPTERALGAYLITRHGWREGPAANTIVRPLDQTAPQAEYPHSLLLHGHGTDINCLRALRTPVPDYGAPDTLTPAQMDYPAATTPPHQWLQNPNHYNSNTITWPNLTATFSADDAMNDAVPDTCDTLSTTPCFNTENDLGGRCHEAALPSHCVDP